MATKRRAARGKGSIFKRTIVVKGKIYSQWVAVRDLGKDAAGKRIRKTFYGKTQAEVAAKLAGQVVTAQRQTVEQYLRGWLNRLDLKPATAESYRWLVESHLIPALGDYQLDGLTLDNVEQMLADKAQELSPRTRAHLRAVLRNALNDALRRRLLTQNVAALAKPVRQADTSAQIRFLEPEEARRLLAAAQGDRLRALYEVALRIGARQGELLALRWADVNFERGTITVMYNLQRVKGKLQLGSPKTGRSRRTVVMTPRLAAVLAAHRERQEQERLLATERWQAAPDLVFRTTLGKPLDGSYVTAEFQKVVSAAGLPQMRFHDLRHSCAALMLWAGRSAREVMELLGHS